MPLPGLCREDQNEAAQGQQDTRLLAHIGRSTCGIVRRLGIRVV